jgi:hypothetical protein
MTIAWELVNVCGVHGKAPLRVITVTVRGPARPHNMPLTRKRTD